MIDAAVARVPLQARFGAIYFVLAAAAFVGGAFLTLNFKTVTIHQTRTVTLTPAQAVQHMSARQIVAALGKPDQQQTKNGTTCALWASKQIEVCWR